MDWAAKFAHLSLESRGLSIVRLCHSQSASMTGYVPDCEQNQSDDSRIGSSRDDSSKSGTVSTLNPSGNLGFTFIPVVVYSTACFAVFFIFRRRCHRVYSPRTVPALLAPE